MNQYFAKYSFEIPDTLLEKVMSQFPNATLVSKEELNLNENSKSILKFFHEKWVIIIDKNSQNYCAFYFSFFNRTTKKG